MATATAADDPAVSLVVARRLLLALALALAPSLVGAIDCAAKEDDADNVFAVRRADVVRAGDDGNVAAAAAAVVAFC